MKPRVAVSILKVIEHMASNTKEASSVHEEFLGRCQQPGKEGWNGRTQMCGDCAV